MSFELREHTADVAVAAEAPTLGGVFAAIADGMAAAQCEAIPETVGERADVALAAEGREALLFDYLDELIYERDIRDVLPVDNEASVSPPGEPGDEWIVEASYRGVPLDEVVARDLKAVTYSEMSIESTDAGWSAYVVFDV